MALVVVMFKPVVIAGRVVMAIMVVVMFEPAVMVGPVVMVLMVVAIVGTVEMAQPVEYCTTKSWKKNKGGNGPLPPKHTHNILASGNMRLEYL